MADLHHLGPAFCLRVLLAILAVATASATALAQYPTRPVRLVVPFPGGGSMDNMGRIMAQAMTQSLGESVIVDNRPGADGAIGADAVIKSAPDGHVLFFTAGSSILAPATLRAKPPYDPVAAFTPVSLIGRSPDGAIFSAFPLDKRNEAVGFCPIYNNIEETLR